LSDPRELLDALDILVPAELRNRKEFTALGGQAAWDKILDAITKFATANTRIAELEELLRLPHNEVEDKVVLLQTDLATERGKVIKMIDIACAHAETDHFCPYETFPKTPPLEECKGCGDSPMVALPDVKDCWQQHLTTESEADDD